MFTPNGGVVQHNFGSTGGFHSNIDFDSTLPLDQTLPSVMGSAVHVVLNGSGPDTVTLGAPGAGNQAGLLGAAFQIDNNSGSTAVIVDDSGSSLGKTMTWDANGISTLLGPEVLNVTAGTNGFNAGITLHTGTGIDSVTMTAARAIALGVEPRTITVTTGDVVNIGGPVLGTLDTFAQQVVTVTAPAPTTAVVTVNDAGDTDPNTYTYTATAVTRGADTSLVTVNYANVQPPVLMAGTGDDTILVRSTPAGFASPGINGGDGNDTITVSSATSSLDGFGAVPLITGGVGTADVIAFDDSGDADANTYAAVGITLTRAGFGTAIVDPTTETVRLLGGTGANTYLAGTLLYRLDIIGNSGPDELVMGVGANLPNGSFNGAGGSNVLNYSAWGTPVSVNLSTDSASGLALVNNVHTVVGGTANDSLIGGPGNDTLIGGPGADSINGGGGDDTFVWSDGDGVDTLAGGSGTDTFQVVGSDAAADTIAVATSGADVAVTRTAPSPFTLTAGPSQGIEQVSVLTQSGPDQVNVQSVPTGVTVVVATGDQDDAVTLDSNGAAPGGTVKGIQGQVQVDGGSGTNTLAVVDADTTAATVAAITPTQAGAAGGNSLFGAGGALTYAGINTLNVTFGSGDDAVTVTPSQSTAYVLAGGAQPSQDSLNILQAGVSGPSTTGSANDGQFTASNRQPVTYTAFEALLLDGVSPNGVIQFASPTYTVDESAGAATITVSRTQNALGAVSVVVGTSNGTATAPADYQTVLTRVDFGPGETSKTVQVGIVADTLNEPSETVNLTLSAVQGGATLGTQTTAVLTIANVAPTEACTPRPRVQTQPVAGSSRLDVHVEATQLNTGQNNRVSALRFGQFVNARVTLNGQTVSRGQEVTLPANMFAADFTVERVTPGQATTVPFSVVDSCGEWKTFVGGGTGAGF